MEERFLTPIEAREYFNISDVTLRKWCKEGKIESIRPGQTEYSHRRYKVSIPTAQPAKPIKPTSREKICYARVSSRDQKEDLERQVQLLQSRYPTHRIVKDIGSGLNFKRKGLKAVLDAAIAGDIEELVVTTRDRLCRFGFELFEQIIDKYNGKILVLNDRDSTPNGEFVEDVISVITVFAARLHGRRSHRTKRIQHQELEENGSGTGEVQIDAV